ncbi:MFS transporter [Celeribacter neptunius]|uniref:Cyanate permease n=1 Tax=Celeribacter neptunius TaxID=588602 RepID=A0A1I3XUW9_9RHOB|nr:MFS transporter [Celeribacter neptunius]SFK23345.1 Cyanate permease [Celeribacter neptunius]
MNRRSFRAPLWEAGFVLAFGYATGVELGKIAPFAGEIAANAGVGLGFVGFLTSALTLFVALFAGFVARPVARYGLARVLKLSALLILSGAVMLALPLAPYMMMAVRVFEGAGYVLAAVAAPAWFAGAPIGRARPVFMALWGSVVPLGFAASAAMAAMLPAAWSPTDGFAAMAAVVAALSLPVLVLPHRDAERQGSALETPPPSPLRLSDLPWGIAVAFGLYVILSMGFFSFLPLYDAQNPAHIGGLRAGFVPLMVPVGNFFTAWLLARLKGDAAIVMAASGFALAALSAGLMFQMASPVPMYAYAFCAGVSASATLSAVLVVSRSSAASTRLLAALAQFGGIAAFLGAPVSGMILERGSWQAMGMTLALVALCAGGCVLRERYRAPRHLGETGY